ncbi:CBS domain-containing protein [Heyndrickxia acidicola]|jgi:predicted transcriptional regulator|uniref:CBS domain-containing protein n=1 Tax=Heyndrickxia acidicola TaxID=209389 RepID=A0ABU6MG99_9BACI|nr:CBS domain-containing protein [Heyndrickxia acidicola]MED1203407.1 CBS domain-containing protein [Heyndrickxia acidicola]
MTEAEKIDLKNQCERFESAFNRIHKSLKQSVKNAHTDKFKELIDKGKSHSLVRAYQDDLYQFAKLRNAIVHEKVDLDYYIAEPHLDIVEEIERIAEDFEKPKQAMAIATKPVFFFYEDGKLEDVLTIIKKFSYSQFPIYNHDGEYVWLLTSTHIVKWLADQLSEMTVDIKKVKVKELYNERFTHQIAFAREDASIFDIEDIYEEYHQNNKKLQGIVLTESGTSKDKPKGFLTSWDLVGVEILDS